MRITPPQHFRHVGELPNKFASTDPRPRTFREARVDLDLRKCEFVRPAAVLWCAVYPLLAAAKGSRTRLLVPENTGVAAYLKAVRLFSVLQDAEIEVDDRGIRPRGGGQVVLPLTRFNMESEVEDLANRALQALSAGSLGAANLHPVVTEVFAELAMNAVQHSESEIGACGFIQFYEFQQGRRFVCAVADGGIGIRRSLERNPELSDQVPYDWVAIELAVRERITGTGSKTRGIGLYGVAEDMRKTGRQLIIHSGIGMLETTEDLEREAKRTTLFPGTLAYASIPT